MTVLPLVPDTDGLVILDIDGTLLDTPHLAAWRQALGEVGGLSEERGARLTSRAYQRRVAGRDRLTGAEAALRIAGMTPSPDLVERLADRKQRLFRRLMHTTRLFPDARRFLAGAAAQRTPLAFCTASRNAGDLLRRCVAGEPYAPWLLPRLDRSLGHHGHRGGVPRGEALLRVVEAWDVHPAACVVVDDAPHGVEAAAALGMRAVLVDRFGEPPPAPAGRTAVTSLDETTCAPVDPARPVRRPTTHPEASSA
ncbi:HAD family hydrolase [Streptomyces collinus]|uniref:HAD family hydrolase n=1 Tax=Streptomyces collinus TaxID=42684 RepID=UPI00363D793F